MSTDRNPVVHAVLIDVLGTLVHDPFHVEVPAFFGTSLQELIESKHPTAWAEFERGALDEATFLESFFLDRRAVDGPGLKACMRSAYRWIDGMQELVRELARGGHALHVLSNYAPWYTLIEERLELSRFLEWSFVSCITGVRKPDPQAFLGPARALGLRPADCLLIDDRPENCTAARAAGMRAHRFEDARGARVELERLGLLQD